MIPKRIELENFLSFGTPAVEFAFTDDEPLWVLCGSNGVGKSAIFDGITYALYGEHRGGVRGADELIRHGANGFRLVFEFEFAGIDYRITRTRSERTTQKVERQIDGQWQSVPGVNSAPDVKAWTEGTLGLKFKAFTTSVLLRQGEADKLFSASRDERIALLKGIIGFEQFEEISKRVHTAAACKGAAYGTLKQQMDSSVPVTSEELTAAETTLTDAERKRETTQANLTVAAYRVEQAKQWEKLETQAVGLKRQLADAAARAEDAETIRTGKTRLDDLTATVPMLEFLVRLRDQIAILEPKLKTSEASQERIDAKLTAKLKAIEETRQKVESHREAGAESDRQVKALTEEIERGTKFLELADAVGLLKERLDGEFPTDLADQLAAVEIAEKTASEANHRATSAVAAADALWHRAEEQQAQFADVETGIPCSRCGQLVDAEHAENERARLAVEIRTRAAEIGQLNAEADETREKHTSAHKRRVALVKQKTQFDKLAAEFAAKSDSLTQLGGVADALELRSRLAGQRQAKTQTETRAANEKTKQTEAFAEAKRLDVERTKLDAELKVATAEVRQYDTDLMTNRTQWEAKREQLRPDWCAKLGSLDAAAVSEFATERNRLQASGVAARFELSRNDEAMQAEWTKQLEAVTADIDLIPVEAQVPTMDAQSRQTETKAEAGTADSARDAAVKTCNDLKARAEEYERLSAQLRSVERDYELHKKLDQLLGQTGLQRELVRDAEQQIVALANDALQNLSDGDLSLEPDDDPTGMDDRAFALRVRRVGDPLPIGVSFLSGSQKFRVAVSIALAVGRFASGRARPLEAVIIDEGFGSLDKDGLRAMADELKRIQRSQSLKRIVLVSHQEEFTGQFPVGYRLEAGENGTTAKPIRNP